MTIVSGFALQHAIKRSKTLIEFHKDRFDKNQTYFDSTPQSGRVDIQQSFHDFLKEEHRLATLKHFQAAFNTATVVTFQETKISLHQAISLIGVYGKSETMWKKAAKAGTTDDVYRLASNSRSKDNEYAKPAVDPVRAMKNAADLALKISELKTAIHVANMATTDIPADLLD